MKNKLELFTSVLFKVTCFENIKKRSVKSFFPYKLLYGKNESANANVSYIEIVIWKQ